LREEERTGVPGPLRDANLFRLVYIDSGAVAWPGDIDFAPDALRAQVLKQSLAA